MQIDPAEPGNRQEPGGNNLTVRNDHYGVGGDAFQKFLRRIGFDRFRLVDVQTGFECRLFHRGAADVLAAPARSVRLRDDSFHRKFRMRGKPPERGYGEFRRATKDDAHHGHPREPDYQSPVFRNLRTRRLIRSLLSMLRCWMKRIPFKWSISWQKARASNPSPRIS